MIKLCDRCSPFKEALLVGAIGDHKCDSCGAMGKVHHHPTWQVMLTMIDLLCAYATKDGVPAARKLVNATLDKFQKTE